MSDAPYRVKIEPTFGIQARVRVWHRPSHALLLDRSVWAMNVKHHAETVARARIAQDLAERRARAREHHRRE